MTRTPQQLAAKLQSITDELQDLTNELTAEPRKEGKTTIKTVDEVLNQMLEAMPWMITHKSLPYIREAMELYASQFRQPVKWPSEAKMKEVKDKQASKITNAEHKFGYEIGFIQCFDWLREQVEGKP